MRGKLYDTVQDDNFPENLLKFYDRFSQADEESLTKSGGIKAAISKLDQSTQGKKEARGGTSEAEAVLVDEANKRNSNKKIEKEEEPLIEAAGQDNLVDPDDVQFRSILDKVIAQFPTRTTPSILRHSSSVHIATN